MKFKKGDKVECISTCGESFTKGKVYTVRENELDKYGNLTIELDDNASKTNGWRPKFFKLIEENKMKTSKEVMAKIYRKMAENLEDGRCAQDGIQYKADTGAWIDKKYMEWGSNVLYRIKPETITLKNGVTIPKPLDEKSMHADTVYYAIYDNHNLYCEIFGSVAMSRGCRFLYKTKEEAIEASKALFGIE